MKKSTCAFMFQILDFWSKFQFYTWNWLFGLHDKFFSFSIRPSYIFMKSGDHVQNISNSHLSFHFVHFGFYYVISCLSEFYACISWLGICWLGKMSLVTNRGRFPFHNPQLDSQTFGMEALSGIMALLPLWEIWIISPKKQVKDTN